MDVDKGDKDTFSKAFSSWTFKEVCKHILKIDPTSVKKLPELKIDELGPQKKLSKEDYEQFSRAIRATQFLLDADGLSNDSEKKLLLFDYFKPVLIHILKEKKIHIKFEVERELEGTCGAGRADYCFVYEEIILIIIQAKQDNFEKGITQAIVEMNVALEKIQKSKKCPTMYGIVSDAFNWIFLQFIRTATEGAKVKSSKLIYSGMQNHEIIFDWILRIVEIQIQNLAEMGVNLTTINPEQCLAS